MAIIEERGGTAEPGSWCSNSFELLSSEGKKPQNMWIPFVHNIRRYGDVSERFRDLSQRIRTPFVEEIPEGRTG